MLKCSSLRWLECLDLQYVRDHLLLFLEYIRSCALCAGTTEELLQIDMACVSCAHSHSGLYGVLRGVYLYYCTIASLCVNIPNIQPDLDPLQAIICCHENLQWNEPHFNSGCVSPMHLDHKDCNCLCSIQITILGHCEALRQTVPLHLRNQDSMLSYQPFDWRASILLEKGINIGVGILPLVPLLLTVSLSMLLP